MRRFIRLVIMVLGLLTVQPNGHRVSAETIITPSIYTGVSYYSNSLFSSNSTGAKSEDYGLTAAPQLSVSHTSLLVSAVGQVGVSATRFFNNENFSFVGINAGGSLNLTNAVQRLIPRTSLSISNYFTYTPQLPGLLGPTLAPLQGEPQASTSPNQPQPLPQFPAGAPFLGVGNGYPQGVNFNGNFAGRVNSYTNGTSVSTGYQFTQTVGLNVGYSHSIAHFGNSFSQPGVGGYFDTTADAVFVGTSYQINQKDTLSVGGGYTHADYGNLQGSTAAQGYDSYSGNVGWSRRLTPTLTGNVSGTYSVVSPGNTSVYGGTVSLGWLVVQRTTASLAFSRGVSTSYVGFGTAMTSNMVTAGIQQVLTSKLSGHATLMGSQAEAVQNNSSNSGFRYESVIGSVGLSYQLTRYFSANAYYSHSWFKSFANGASPSFNLDSVNIGISGSFPYKWS